MNAVVQHREFLDRVVGQRVTDRQLAGNSLSLWIGGRPTERVGFTIWLEPTWQLASPAGVLAGSRQAQDEEEPSGFAAVTKSLDALVGRTVEAVEIDPQTGDLVVTLSGGIVARTFVADPRDSDLWIIKDLAAERQLSGSARAASVAQDA